MQANCQLTIKQKFPIFNLGFTVGRVRRSPGSLVSTAMEQTSERLRKVLQGQTSCRSQTRARPFQIDSQRSRLEKWRRTYTPSSKGRSQKRAATRFFSVFQEHRKVWIRRERRRQAALRHHGGRRHRRFASLFVRQPDDL